MDIEEKANNYIAGTGTCHNKGLNSLIKTREKTAFIAGVEWMQSNGKMIPLIYEKMMLDAKEQLIDKAVEWLKENMDNYYNIDLIELCTDFHMDEFIEDFKKMMENR